MGDGGGIGGGLGGASGGGAPPENPAIYKPPVDIPDGADDDVVDMAYQTSERLNGEWYSFHAWLKEDSLTAACAGTFMYTI